MHEVLGSIPSTKGKKERNEVLIHATTWNDLEDIK
jgi:hypothetical protein